MDLLNTFSVITSLVITESVLWIDNAIVIAARCWT